MPGAGRGCASLEAKNGRERWRNQLLPCGERAQNGCAVRAQGEAWFCEGLGLRGGNVKQRAPRNTGLIQMRVLLVSSPSEIS